MTDDLRERLRMLRKLAETTFFSSWHHHDIAEQARLHAAGVSVDPMLREFDELDAVLAAAREPQPPQGWQPISTAPRFDVVLIYCPPEMPGDRCIFEAWWRTPYENAPASQCWWCYDGNKTMLSADVHTSIPEGKPLGATHWTPLPSAPTRDESAAAREQPEPPAQKELAAIKKLAKCLRLEHLISGEDMAKRSELIAALKTMEVVATLQIENQRLRASLPAGEPPQET